MEIRLVSVIIPCFNEESVILETCNRIHKVLTGDFPYDYEIICINDGSTDRTIEILEDIARRDGRMKIVNFSRNFGHQPALSAGIRYCRGDVAIIMDADLQDPPELIPDMINFYLARKCNVVYGVRTARKGETFFKKITAGIFYRFINLLSEIPLPLNHADFRLVDRNVMREFNKLLETNKYIRGLVTWLGFKQMPFYYERDSRYAGTTKYSLASMIRFATTGLLYFSKKPLRIAVNLGLVSILASVVLGAYALVSKLVPSIGAVRGWTSILIVIVFYSGIQLVIIGMVGQYIASIFDEVKGRPEYIVDTTVNF